MCLYSVHYICIYAYEYLICLHEYEYTIKLLINTPEYVVS